MEDRFSGLCRMYRSIDEDIANHLYQMNDIRTVVNNSRSMFVPFHAIRSKDYGIYPSVSSFHESWLTFEMIKCLN